MQIKTPTDSQVMIRIVEWMISETTNKEYHRNLYKIVEGLKSKRWMEAENNPKLMSIVLFGRNIFPFEMKDYKAMVKLL